jgi:hypothetical protein
MHLCVLLARWEKAPGSRNGESADEFMKKKNAALFFQREKWSPIFRKKKNRRGGRASNAAAFGAILSFSSKPAWR